MANVVFVTFLKKSPRRGAPEIGQLTSESETKAFTSSGTSQQSDACPFENAVARIYTDTDICIKAGADPTATTSDMFIPAAASSAPYPTEVGVQLGDKIAVINHS